MDLPFHYLHIKNMLNLTLFGDLNADENFRKLKYISIRPDYIEYYQEFKKELLLDNKFLKYHIKQYLSIVSNHEKPEIVKVLAEFTKNYKLLPKIWPFPICSADEENVLYFLF